MKRLSLVPFLLAAPAAHAAALATLTAHVPESVASHRAAPAGVPDASQTLELSISLPPRDKPGLDLLIRQITNPASPLFRHYLSVADFTARFGPPQADYDALRAFAAAHNLRARPPVANRRLLDVTGTVADIQAAFHVTMRLYQDPDQTPGQTPGQTSEQTTGQTSGQTPGQTPGQARVFYAPDREPTLDLAVPVLHISGLDNEILPHPRLMRGSRDEAVPGTPTGSGPGGNFIGSDIRAAYYGGTALTGAGQSIGLLEYAGYNIADVQNYFAQVKQPFNVPIVGVSLNGAKLGCKNKCDDGEQALDIEEAISMAPALFQLVVYVGHNDVSMLNQMAVDNSSRQLSSSWGWKADAETIDPILEEFAAQGQSFVDATGDDGYHLLRDAVWPGDDQYVTGVGGTDLRTDGPGGAWAREIGWYYSGGGPSPDHIAIPAYQVPFITPNNNGSKKLRNVPDIAGDANTDNYSCYDGGCYTGNGGTSYAAPLWAGFLALANQQAAAMNKPPLGFLNPALYAIGGAGNYHKSFHDEVRGNNQRYIAFRGFDLVTGFGSPAGQGTIDALIRGK